MCDLRHQEQMSRYNRPVLKDQVKLERQVERKDHRSIEFHIKFRQPALYLLLVLKCVYIFHLPKSDDELHLEDRDQE